MNLATRTGAEDVVWDLSDLYFGPDDPRLPADMDDALAGARAFRETYHGHVGALDAASLREALVELERITALEWRATAYGSLRFSTDTADAARGALLQELRERATAIQAELVFFRLEWLAVPDERASALASDPLLANYRHHLESSRRYQPYVLSEPEERILTEKRVSGASAWSRLFNELTSAIRVGIDGIELGLEQAMSLLQHADRGERQRAFQAITAALEPGLRTRAYVFNTLLLDKAVDDRLRGYPNWIASRNLSNEASDASVRALIDAVVGRYDIPQRYYRLKAKLLGLPQIAAWDRLAPVGRGGGAVTPWRDARDLVVGAYGDFSPRAGTIVDGFFERRWIDAAIAPDKQPGAYCATTVPGVHPYVFMSYTGERRSVLTLAHELGHGLHGVLSSGQTPLNAGTPLTMAETASVFGEALTFRRLLSAEADPAERLTLLVGRLDDTVSTVFRQIAMNRFEEAVHTARRERGELSIDTFSELWTRTQLDLFADSVEASDGYETWWSYIPHFIGSPGYVYAYAFGYLFSLAIFRKYVREGDRIVEPYLQLLAAGGSDTPENLAAIVGLDLSDPGFWADALTALDELLVEAERLADVRS